MGLDQGDVQMRAKAMRFGQAMALLLALAGPVYGSEPVRSIESWDDVQELEPVWVLAVVGDTARILVNEFESRGDGTGDLGEFPLGSVQLRKEWTEPTQSRRWRLVRPHVQKAVNRDGSLPDETIQWLPEVGATGNGFKLAWSHWGQLAVFATSDETQVVSYNGKTIARLPQETVWATCHDTPQRILAVAREELETGQYRKALHRIMVLDYSGEVLYKGDLTDCQFNAGATSLTGETVVYWLAGCEERGKYLIRVDEGTVFNLANLPEGAHRFSPSFRHVLVNNDGEVGTYESTDPESPSLIWQGRISSEIRDIAISDGAELIAYRVKSPRDRLPYVYVMSGIDGRALCKLRMDPDHSATGPLAFCGQFLFVGTHFGSAGATSNTDHIYLFNLNGASPHVK